MARGVVTQIDSADFFVQALDSTAAIIATQTATNGSGGSPVSADITNRVHRSASFYIAIASLTVNTATLAVLINGKNAVDGLYYQVARVSLDGIAANGNYGISLGQGNTQAVGGGSVLGQGVLPAVFQVQASLTVTTTASMSGTLAYAIRGMSRTL